ncbi:iron complex transport system permease protein [Rhodothalassium salexigens DSM 2132]|uniref:Iron complex transport system permease protein n=1 Tax=Rhodothalassium salexigens DSM 2132 TaxID=1188247 RepID=A0A4R2PWB7_RHOSA|nr:iron ABC transporter permease [Rhodothalassium salexigens]MBB4210381.1 iron complex transport system permease protein [Rhodothalassium salexigens DSM 2132]MBK1638582.1 ABC transporter permease [Rhodothalassium salexigens DSM 2132]TCP38545.1 iron complex transport system permease protein [Rhodothalassium salexigens DSM 2132]
MSGRSDAIAGRRSEAATGAVKTGAADVAAGDPDTTGRAAVPRDRFWWLIAALVLAVVVLFGVSLLVGPAALGLGESLEALFTGRGDAAVLVMQEIRLPRAILGAMIGATLGLSGAVLQGYLRNPLAEPGLIGVSGSASLGAVLAIYTGLSAQFALALPLMALGGALVAVMAVQAMAGRGGSITLILAGIAVSAFASALTSLALNLSPNPFAALEIVFWMLGSLADRSMVHVQLAAPFMVAGWIMLGSLGRALDALSVGDDTAASMGVNVLRVRNLAVVGTAASVGAATAVAGAIGFVGLVVPHILRPLVGARPSRLLLASALGGAAMLLAADVAVRLVAPDKDLKLGVLTSLVGAPFFLWLIYRTRRNLV